MGFVGAGVRDRQRLDLTARVRELGGLQCRDLVERRRVLSCGLRLIELVLADRDLLLGGADPVSCGRELLVERK